MMGRRKIVLGIAVSLLCILAVTHPTWAATFFDGTEIVIPEGYNQWSREDKIAYLNKLNQDGVLSIDGLGKLTEALVEPDPNFGFESVTVSRILEQVLQKIRGRLVAVSTTVASVFSDIFGTIQNLEQRTDSTFNQFGQLTGQRGHVEGEFSQNDGLVTGTLFGDQKFVIVAGGLAVLEESNQITDTMDTLNMTHSVTISKEKRAVDRATGRVDAEATTGGATTFTNNLNFALIDPEGDPSDPANRKLVDGYEVMTVAVTTNEYENIAGSPRVVRAITEADTYDFITETFTATTNTQGTAYHAVTGEITGGTQSFESVQTHYSQTCGENNECLIRAENGNIIDTTLDDVTYSRGSNTLALSYSKRLLTTNSLTLSVSITKDPEDFSDPEATGERGANVTTSVNRTNFRYRRLADGTLTGILEDADGTFQTISKSAAAIAGGGLNGYELADNKVLARTEQNTTLDAVVVNNNAVFNEFSTRISGFDKRPDQEDQAFTDGTSNTVLNVNMETGEIEGGTRTDNIRTGNAAGGGIAACGSVCTESVSTTEIGSIGNQQVDLRTVTGSLTSRYSANGDLTQVSFNGNTTITAYDPLKGVPSIDLANSDIQGFDNATIELSGPPEREFRSLTEIMAYCGAAEGNCFQDVANGETGPQYANRLLYRPPAI